MLAETSLYRIPSQDFRLSVGYSLEQRPSTIPTVIDPKKTGSANDRDARAR